MRETWNRVIGRSRIPSLAVFVPIVWVTSCASNPQDAAILDAAQANAPADSGSGRGANDGGFSDSSAVDAADAEREAGSMTAGFPLSPSRVLVVYNASYTGDDDGDGVQDSLEVANYYLAMRGVPSGNVLGLTVASGSTETEPSYASLQAEIIQPLQNKLTSIGSTSIDVILFCYGVPYRFSGLSIDNIVVGLWYCLPREKEVDEGLGELEHQDDVQGHRRVAGLGRPCDGDFFVAGLQVEGLRHEEHVARERQSVHQPAQVELHERAREGDGVEIEERTEQERERRRQAEQVRVALEAPATLDITEEKHERDQCDECGEDPVGEPVRLASPQDGREKRPLQDPEQDHRAHEIAHSPLV
jgi:hypothetical protein